MKKLILIVDDEPNVRLSYRTALETEGYDVMEADSAARALELSAENRFDLVTLDMRMPEVGGLELLETMRARGLKTPVIIITAYGDIPHAVLAIKLGAIDFLQKPLTPEALRDIVAEIILRHEVESATPEQPRDDFQSHVRAAKRLLNLQDLAAAKEHLVAALEMNRNSTEAFNLAGVLFEASGDYDRARKYYGEAIRLDNKYEPAQHNMRRIFELFHFGSSTEPFSMGD